MSDPVEVTDERNVLLIIKSKPQSVTGAETFLRNRKWEIFTATDLRDALQMIVTHQPRYVMVSVDHPNKKVRQLPRLLIQAFPVITIAFAETQSGSAITAIQELGLRYSIFPPISGPAVERTMNKIKRDLAAEQTSREQTASAIKDLRAAKSEDVIVSGSGSSGAARDILMRLMKSEGEGPAQGNFIAGEGMSSTGQIQQDGTIKPSGIAYLPDHALAQKASGSYVGDTSSGLAKGYNPSHAPTEGTGSYTPGQTPGTSSGGYMPGLPSPDKNGFYQPAQNSDDKNATKSAVDYFSQPEPGQPSSSDDSVEKNSKPLSSYNPQGDTPSHSHRPAEAPVQYGGTLKKKEPPKFTMDQTPDGRLRKPEPEHTNELMKEATQQALDASAKASPAVVDPQKIEETTKVVCIVVESPRFTGYLVAALGKNRTLDQQFQDSVRVRLIDFLKENGEEFSIDEGMPLEILEIEFEDWALEYAEFLRKAVHQGEEVAMAFFPVQPKSPMIGESKADNMASVGIDDLFEDSTLDFDVYIYLPHNDKYILYTPQGRTFYGKQKERLKNKGVSELHVRKENISDVKKYHSQNFLNSKIEAYRDDKAKAKVPKPS